MSSNKGAIYEAFLELCGSVMGDLEDDGRKDTRYGYQFLPLERGRSRRSHFYDIGRLKYFYKYSIVMGEHVSNRRFYLPISDYGLTRCVQQMITDFCISETVFQYGGCGCTGRAMVYVYRPKNNHDALLRAEGGIVVRMLDLLRARNNSLSWRSHAL